MKLKKENCLLYAVTDRTWLNGNTLAFAVEEALKGGITMLQLREKNLEEDAFLKEALEIKALCQRYQVPFLINDNVKLAQKVDADGVHIGQGDMELTTAREILGQDKIIGVTAKTVKQAQEAQKNGADYIGSGAVFGTQTKLDTKKLELSVFQEICESVSIPVVAIGGITIDNVKQLANRKAAGIAVVSGIFASKDIKSQTRKLLGEVKEICGSNEE